MANLQTQQSKIIIAKICLSLSVIILSLNFIDFAVPIVDRTGTIIHLERKRVFIVEDGKTVMNYWVTVLWGDNTQQVVELDGYTYADAVEGQKITVRMQQPYFMSKLAAVVVNNFWITLASLFTAVFSILLLLDDNEKEKNLSRKADINA